MGRVRNMECLGEYPSSGKLHLLERPIGSTARHVNCRSVSNGWDVSDALAATPHIVTEQFQGHPKEQPTHIPARRDAGPSLAQTNYSQPPQMRSGQATLGINLRVCISRLVPALKNELTLHARNLLMKLVDQPQPLPAVLLILSMGCVDPFPPRVPNQIRGRRSTVRIGLGPGNATTRSRAACLSTKCRTERRWRLLDSAAFRNGGRKTRPCGPQSPRETKPWVIMCWRDISRTTRRRKNLRHSRRPRN